MSGEAVDMMGDGDLTGCCILVVEDNYHLATDTAHALREAGADILGPCATEDRARSKLDERRPDAVVMDINLGLGVSFKLAKTLKDADIPFIFTTGYDEKIIPPEFKDIECLEKPFELRQIVRVVARLTGAAQLRSNRPEC